MEREKVHMWRVPPEVVALVDSMAAAIAADPGLLAAVGMRHGKPTRAGILRLLVARGWKSVQGTMRERPATKVDAAPPATKAPPAKVVPTKAPATKAAATKAPKGRAAAKGAR